MSERFLELDGVSVNYGATTVLHQVDLTLAEGESLGVIGESGSGKTTLARAILGLVRPAAGDITFRGAQLNSRRSSRRGLRREVQPVFQDGVETLDPRMRIGDIVAEGLAGSGMPRAERRARVEELLVEVDLDPGGGFTDRLPHELSGGQRQRVGIARALAVRPTALLLDEPTSALDVTVQARILDLLDRLRRERGLGLILISHNLAVVERLCPTSMVLFAGRVVETGPTTELLANAAHPYTAALRDAVPVLGGDPPTPSTSAAPADPDGCPFRSRCDLPPAAVCAEQPPPLRMVHSGSAGTEPGLRRSACHFAETCLAQGRQ